MNKAENLFNIDSCLNKAEADEPIFVLRANDPCAATAIRHWATMALGRHEQTKIIAAFKVADDMELWRKNKVMQPVEKG